MSRLPVCRFATGRRHIRLADPPGAGRLGSPHGTLVQGLVQGLVIGLVGGLLGLLAPAAPAYAQQGPHVHGRLSLGLAVDADALRLDMVAPLDSLLGFEHAPRNAAEHTRVTALQARLQAAEGLIAPDPAAICQLAKVTMTSPILGLASANEGEHDQDLDHDPGQSADPAHSESRHEEHGDIEVQIVFHCAAAAKLRFVDLRGLFAAFRGLEGVDAQVATASAQTAQTVTRAAPRLALGR